MHETYAMGWVKLTACTDASYYLVVEERTFLPPELLDFIRDFLHAPEEDSVR